MSIRPIHSNFETLRHAAVQAGPAAHHYSRFPFPTNEQLSARATTRSGRIARPSFLFSVFREV